MEVSSTSMKVASVTVMAMIQGLTAGRQIRRRYPAWRRNSAHCWIQTLGVDRHAGAQQVIVVFSGIEHDLYRDALHYLHIIAGGILRRQQAETAPLAPAMLSTLPL